MKHWILVPNVNEWVKLTHLSFNEFEEYIEFLSDTEKELAQQYETQRKGREIILDMMKEYSNFYTFIKNFSPVDYKYIDKKQYVSNRVTTTHLELWHITHPYSKLEHLRVFSN